MVNARNKRLGEARSVIREIFEYGNARKREIGEENVFDFSIGNPGVPAPREVNEEIVRLVKTVPSLKLHGYTSAAGAPEVREAVADYIRTAFGVPMSAEGVYMTCGAAASLTITLGALCEEGDEFVIVTPCFPEYRVFIESAGGKVVEAACRKDFHPDMDALEKAVGVHTKGVIINSPNNPTGAVYSRTELQALGALLMLFGANGALTATTRQTPRAQAETVIDAADMVREVGEICQAADLCAADLALIEQDNAPVRLSGTADEAMLDLLSAMMGAPAPGRPLSPGQDLALRSLDQAEQYLRMLGVQSVFYDAEHAALFDVLPARSGERTVRPALVRDGELVRRGVAAVAPMAAKEA